MRASSRASALRIGLTPSSGRVETRSSIRPSRSITAPISSPRRARTRMIAVDQLGEAGEGVRRLALALGGAPLEEGDGVVDDGFGVDLAAAAQRRGREIIVRLIVAHVASRRGVAPQTAAIRASIDARAQSASARRGGRLVVVVGRDAVVDVRFFLDHVIEPIGQALARSSRRSAGDVARLVMYTFEAERKCLCHRISGGLDPCRREETGRAKTSRRESRRNAVMAGDAVARDSLRIRLING